VVVGIYLMRTPHSSPFLVFNTVDFVNGYLALIRFILYLGAVRWKELIPML
jgi:hypothetical protein